MKDLLHILARTFHITLAKSVYKKKMDAFGTNYPTLEALYVMLEIYCIYRPEKF